LFIHAIATAIAVVLALPLLPGTSSGVKTWQNQ
jgi:hypothetical protein